ncbi:TetR/AcrR family transcriptional regulator [Mycolicibacterium litorale]|uniref:TetR family transcriptional regulator n=1 Tax=Mycolicibacterium litorale TaxID=758802 RepID=A0AAD1ILY5_9MYCO|nr:TetR family transcriptional regulator [Mycolicibacterium litorale]MCV7416932.1 TetR/AcrR family transcriptional regulator [Mycolicibacterium litorale]TDY04717.1 TetR family transcriptional regulator [Mycolicibacterium litorale]BBY18145.1 TetR family transcriptional regulator [Mycolicibacterium litorale]
MRRSSEHTKTLILSAARERFGKAGYDRATIRAIAGDAGIDPSMVMRYFGSKEELFAAAARFDLELPDLSAVADDDVGRRLVAHFVERWERDEALVVLLRAAATNAVAGRKMADIFTTQLLPAVVAIGADDPSRRAGLIATQMLGLALCRYILALPPVADMSCEEIEYWLGPTVQRYLTDPQ